MLESYVLGEWRCGAGRGTPLRDASTGEILNYASSEGIDFGQVRAYARSVGGPALRLLTFHERAALLRSVGKKLLEFKEEFYALSYRTGATRADSWVDIDGGIGTVLSYASKAGRELPNSTILLDGDVEPLSRNGTFVGQHVCLPLEGVAVHINAFNFPVWGMLEKLAPALLAGVPVIVKPATATAYLTEAVVRRVVEMGVLPAGALQLVCGSLGNLFDHLDCQDVVSFTGSASTALKLRSHPVVQREAVRFVAETDSLNSAVLGSDAGPGTPEFDLFVREVVREMTTKAGQKCTAIRKIIVPAEFADAIGQALTVALGKVVVGDPRTAGVTMGPLASAEQRSEVCGRIRELEGEADVLVGAAEIAKPDADGSALMAPVLMRCRDPQNARRVHSVEAFGPVATILTYAGVDEAIALARRGEGSLVASVFTADAELAARVVRGLVPYHGRVLVVDRQCAAESTGHGSPLAPLVHGGPGRAGGGEELGGMRAVLHYMQRTAVQGSPDVLSLLGGRWIRGGSRRDPGCHPFRKAFHELAIGDTLVSGYREVTVADIEAFAALTGDNFYAHMSDTEAARNPLFGSRVAHGYFLISAAAGLFVDADYGPVLGNYGLDSLRFVKPAKPGDRIRVRLTCKQKSLRAEKGWGEVRWDTEITNQSGETVASYDVLTMVSTYRIPDQGV